MEKDNNQIKIKLTTIIVLISIVAILIIGILFIIINNNSHKNDNAEKAQVEDNKSMTNIDFEDYGKPISCGSNVQYRYNEKTQTVIITGLGTADLTQDYSSEIIGYEDSFDEFDHPIYKYTGMLIFPSETKKIVICEGITNIRNLSAGYEGGIYENLEEIVLPNSIKMLEPCCFAGQKNLKKINIPSSIEIIPGGAFKGCEKLNKIELPEGLKIIGSGAFSECNKLYYINFPKSLRIIKNKAFYKCATLPEVKLNHIGYIGGSAFEGCYNLKTVEINGDIERLYSYTFDVCLNLKDVKMTNNIKYIANDTFRNCKSLEDGKLFYNREKTVQYQEVQDREKLEEFEMQIMNE